MKNYLNSSLSEEEKKLINAIIWVTSKSYKNRKYKRKTYNFIPIDDLNLSVEDEYDFLGIKPRGNFDFIKPLTEIEKIDVVDYVDNILMELSLKKFKVALTFDEKLVLFLCFFKHYSEKKASYLLKVKVRRISYLKETYKIKKEKYLGGYKNV